MANSRLLDKALKQMSDGWFPVQEEVLDKVRNRFEAGEYEEDRQALTEDLKSDFALYMYCVKKLSEMLQSGEINNQFILSQVQDKSPHEILESCDHEVLKKIFSFAKTDISVHRMENVTELQAMRLQESLLSATTAEVLAESSEVDPQLGYACGLMRQLGLTLLSWNYPKIYEKAFSMMSEKESLDNALHRLLGFSPTMLGIRFARNWNLSGKVRLALGDRSYSIASQKNPLEDIESPASEDENVIGETIAKICEVGEALARANHPEHYPNALADWETAEAAIKEHLGSEGVEKIFERTQAYSSEYTKSNPKWAEYVDRSPKRETIVSSQSIKLLLERNSYLNACSSSVQQKVSKVYNDLKDGKSSKEILRFLFFEVVPHAGFQDGCVFTFDPVRNVLAPVFQIGKISAERAKVVPLSTHLSEGDLVAAALSCKSPLREQKVEDDGQVTSLFAGILGSEENPVGVLYLEQPENESAKEDEGSMIIFQALRQCLRDCLSIAG